MTEKELFDKRIAREIKARKAAEAIMEEKSLELFEANQKLLKLNASLENQVEQRTLELAKTEAKYLDLVKSATDLIFIVGPDGIISYANEIAKTLYGYSPKGIEGTHIIEYIHPDYRENLLSKLKNARSKKTGNLYLECPSFEWHGNWIWLGLKMQFKYNQSGSLEEVLTIGRDITEQKERESELYNTQVQLKELITNMQQGVLFESKDGIILQLNQFYCDFFNIPQKASELVNKRMVATNLSDLSLIENGQELLHKLKSSNEKIVGRELKLKDGRYIRYDWIPIYSKGEFMGNLRQFIDITAQKDLEVQIRTSEEKYRGIIESMELGLLEVDNDGVIVKAYDWFCKMTGYTPKDLLGQKAKGLLPEEFQDILDENDKIRARGEQSVYEVQLTKKDGDRIWMLVAGAPFYNPQGDIIGSMGIHFDLTSRKELENELIEAKKIAEHAQEVERQFLANMSHEIRTPLNAVIGMSHLLYDTNPSKEQKDYVDMIQYSAKLLANLVNDILDFSKIKSGHIDLNEVEFDLSAMLSTLHKTFKLKAANKPVEIEADFPNLDTLVYGDETLINQVLFNLMGNAEKFTESGSIKITATINNVKNDDLWVRFDIADTGIGIAKDRLTSIFNQFDQEDRDTKLKYGGTGLGLTITKQIIDFLGGEINVASEKGKGSVFSVSFPLKQTQKSIIIEAAVQDSISSGKQVLVVEDNIMNQNYIKKLLEKEGIHYEIANNGQEAVNITKEKKFDLIFMDISMPVMDGYESTINIRNNGNINKNTPIVALTASAISMKKNKAFEVGMTDYMTKPFTPNELKRTLSNYLGIDTEGIAQEVKVSHSETILDRETLSMFYDDDTDYAAEMFGVFLENFDEQQELLHQAIKEKNWEEAQKLAHKMKPTFSMVGAPKVQQIFQELEDHLRHKKTSEIEASWQEAIASLDMYIPAVKTEFERILRL